MSDPQLPDCPHGFGLTMICVHCYRAALKVVNAADYWRDTLSGPAAADGLRALVGRVDEYREEMADD